jgi:hypothetical protein
MWWFFGINSFRHGGDVGGEPLACVDSGNKHAHLYYASAGVVRRSLGHVDVASWQIKKLLPRFWVRQFSSWSSGCELVISYGRSPEVLVLAI